ncbi:MAG: nicotinamide mononucleotide transporter [Bacteroidales bacterium]|nr:nicotinamide mononucleotide transporter [Bacteroidales bacterium]HOY39524.1 nicotinamide riboside transporter PnuC [Bacteroidales bacterium]HQP04058.1 nicotinamide riboside transporter PnuC [Bacteroidales bacterium]
MSETLEWIRLHWVELAGACLGLWSIYLQILRKPLYWPVSIVMVILYIFVYFHARIYADMSFQFYYLAISIYGWYYWITHKRAEKETVESDISRITRLTFWSIVIFCTVVFVALGLVLSEFTDSDVPWCDALTTSLSFAATWLLARKVLENWLFWIVVDSVSVAIYIYKGLYPTAFLFTVLTALAFVGYFKWKKEIH